MAALGQPSPSPPGVSKSFQRQQDTLPFWLEAEGGQRVGTGVVDPYGGSPAAKWGLTVNLLNTRLSWLRGEVFPGQAEDADFFGCWLVRARCLKSGGDDDAAELGGHVGGRRRCLGGVPGGT